MTRSIDELFNLLSDRTRLDVLREIAFAKDEREEVAGGPVTLSFSEIYDRVEVDTTSQLSYHLGELTGSFLRKDDDGYSFTHAGERIVRFVLSGNYEQPAAFGPEPLDGTCVFCGNESLEASLRHQFFRIDCTDCGRQTLGQPTTAAQTRSRDTEALIRSVQAQTARYYRAIRRGTCPECSGPVSTTVVEMGDGPLPDAESFLVTSQCRECLREYNCPLTYSAVYHPASVAFHWERGVDVSHRGIWEFNDELHGGRWQSERVGREPDEYRVTFRIDDDSLRLLLDEDAQVTRTERVRRDGDGQSR